MLYRFFLKSWGFLFPLGPERTSFHPFGSDSTSVENAYARSYQPFIPWELGCVHIASLFFLYRAGLSASEPLILEPNNSWSWGCLVHRSIVSSIPGFQMMPLALLLSIPRWSSQKCLQILWAKSEEITWSKWGNHIMKRVLGKLIHRNRVCSWTLQTGHAGTL